MPTFANVQNRILGNHGPAVALLHRNRGERSQDIHLSQDLGGMPEPGRLLRDLLLERLKEFLLESRRAFFRAKDFVLVLLEFRRDVAFLVLERLLSEVILWNAGS